MAFRQAWPTPPVSTRKFLPDISDLPGDFRWYATLAATRLNTNFVCSVTRVKDRLVAAEVQWAGPRIRRFHGHGTFFADHLVHCQATRRVSGRCANRSALR